jgi:hypothetical protein
VKENMTSTRCRRERVRLDRRAVVRREPCHSNWAALLAGRLYVGHREAGVWTLRAVEAGRTSLLVVVGDACAMPMLAAAMLTDAFPGRAVRRDLLDAFVAAWTPPDGGFVLPADVVAGWSLRWALDHEPD